MCHLRQTHFHEETEQADYRLIPSHISELQKESDQQLFSQLFSQILQVLLSFCDYQMQTLYILISKI